MWDERNDIFFKEDGDLLIDEEFYDGKITKLLTISLTQNPLY
jgi:hypothetical protein